MRTNHFDSLINKTNCAISSGLLDSLLQDIFGKVVRNKSIKNNATTNEIWICMDLVGLLGGAVFVRYLSNVIDIWIDPSCFILDFFFVHPINDDILGFCCVTTNYFILMDVDLVFFSHWYIFRWGFPSSITHFRFCSVMPREVSLTKLRPGLRHVVPPPFHRCDDFSCIFMQHKYCNSNK